MASPEEREVAERVCTVKELEAWRLRDRGLSRWAMSLALGVGMSAVRDRLRNADRKIAIEIAKED